MKPLSLPMEVDLGSQPEYVRERWPLAVARATRKAEALSSTGEPEEIGQFVKAAQNASTASQRVIWLQRAASAWSQPMHESAACRKGCSHCCNIPLTISSLEANLIGRHIGRTPAKPGNAVRLDSFDDMDAALEAVRAISTLETASPCPFLVDSACSVYQARPIACRLLINLDDDDLLCHLVPGVDIPVPYADSTKLKVYGVVAQVSSPMADIRDFFPGPT